MREVGRGQDVDFLCYTKEFKLYLVSNDDS